MKNISLAIFGKSLNELTYQDVATFFQTEQVESNNVEFKGFNQQYGNFNNNFKGVIRAICGFLNSEGGIVIWGAPLGMIDPASNQKRFIGALSPIPEYKEKDWIINKISDNITPLPTGIEVSILQLSTSENIYIIEVQNSQYKPHQFENTYFVRLDGQTKPAPHYFIEALFRRITYPNIEGYIKIDRAGLIPRTSQYYLKITVFVMNFSKLQNEENINLRFMTSPGFFKSSLETSQPFLHFHKIDILHFGLIDFHSEIITIPQNKLAERDNRVNLMLTFGGKYSPAKISNYILDLNNIDLKNPQNTNQLFEHIEENEFFAEKQEQLGTTRESTILQSVGRRPKK